MSAPVLCQIVPTQRRTALLFGNVGLTLRPIRPSVLGWFGAVSAFGLLLVGRRRRSRRLRFLSPGRAVLGRLDGGGPAEPS